MIRNLKLIKYGHQFKFSMVCSVLFILMGTVMTALANDYKIPSIYLLFYCSFLFVTQILSTLMASSIVKTSPKYRKFCLELPRVINIACFFIPLIIIMAIRIIQTGSIEKFKSCIGNELVIVGFTYLIFLIYTVFVYKFFIISVILFLISCIFMNVLSSFISVAYNFTFVQGAGISVLFFIFGIILSEIITRVTYKAQPSRLAQPPSFRKYI